MDVSSSPWLTFGANPQPPETTPKLGWMTESLEIDPFDGNRMMYGTGATLYGTEDLKKWDTGSQFTFQGTEPGGINEGGTIAAAADGSRFVWAPKDVGVHHSAGYGNSWTASTGLPANAVVESDRVNSSRFYGFSAGRFYASANGGASFAATAAPPTGNGCTATYKVTNSWPGGFQAEVTVQNTGTSATTGWTVKWSFPNGQTITQLWSGVHTQTGADVTVKNVSWNGALAAGASTAFGFGASWTGTNGVPSTVTCTAP